MIRILLEQIVQFILRRTCHVFRQVHNHLPANYIIHERKLIIWPVSLRKSRITPAWLIVYTSHTRSFVRNFLESFRFTEVPFSYILLCGASYIICSSNGHLILRSLRYWVSPVPHEFQEELDQRLDPIQAIARSEFRRVEASTRHGCS